MLNYKRVRIILLLAFIMGAMVFAFLSQAGAAGDISITAPTTNKTIAESHDFATERFADPWDMSKYTDISYGEYTNDMGKISWRGGMLSAKTTGTDSAFHPLFPGYEGVVFNGRDGYINRIGTRKYNRFSIRMYSSRKTSAQLFWFYNQRWTDFGVLTFHVDPGWNTYILNPNTTGKWQGKPMGLRFDPTVHKGTTIKVDWMRLYQQSKKRVTVAWTDRNPSGETEIYVDLDRNPGNGNMDLLASQASRSSNSYRWDPSPYEPRSYYFYIKKPGQPGVYSNRVTINRAPLTKILNPDEAGGRDYASQVSGDPWDMNQRSDVWYWENMKDVKFSNGKMSGTPTNGDSLFHLRVPKPINTDKYHRLSFRFRYSGPFDYGAGTMSRVIWTPNHDELSLFQTINDIVTYPTWQTYTIDLKKATMDGGSIGWNGIMNDFRFDPLEWRAQHRFYIDFIKLKTDDGANKRFRIKWRDYKRSPRRTRVNLFYDNNKSGYNGKMIAKNRLQVRGQNKFTWNTTNVRPGKYYIYAVARDGINKTRAYSSGPVVIRH